MYQKNLVVLQISSHFYPKIDGTVRSIDTLLQGLSKRQHKVYLITRKMLGTPCFSNHHGVKVIRVGPSGKSFFQKLILGINQAFFVVRLFRRKRMDVIDTHGFSSLIAGFILKKIYHVPLVFTFHGLPRLWAKEFHWIKWYEHFFSYPLERLLIRKVDKILVRSELFAEIVTSIYGVELKDKIEVIPHAVDLKVFKYTPPKVTDKKVVLFVGTLSKVHGVSLLIQAASLILKDMQNVLFVIVGKGPLKFQLQKLVQELGISKSVIFVGLVKNREKLAKYYQESTVVVVPLNFKGYILSLVVVEALATGRPVVTTLLLDPNLQNVGVFCVRDYTPDALANAIKKILLSDINSLGVLSVKSRNFIEKFHSYDAYLTRIENTYLNLIKDYGIKQR